MKRLMLPFSAYEAALVGFVNPLFGYTKCTGSTLVMIEYAKQRKINSLPLSEEDKDKDYVDKSDKDKDCVDKSDKDKDYVDKSDKIKTMSTSQTRIRTISTSQIRIRTMSTSRTSIKK
ncbi:2152_t:CDS:2, partial [Paraglomus brasilianum]